MFSFKSHATEKDHAGLKFCLMKFSCVLGNVFPRNLADVFPDFKLGWIGARTFREPLGE